MNFNPNKQTLVEFAEHIATTKGNARWAHHNFVYLLFQRSVFNHVEESESFKNIPVAFSSHGHLIAWAKQNVQQVSTLGLPPTDALLTTGTQFGPELLNGQQFVWVRATAKNYRAALLAWMDTQRTSSYQQLHNDAADYCAGVAAALRGKVIRRKISDARRRTLAREFDMLSTAFRNASANAQTAVANKHLLDLLDRSLDADHIINKQSLKNLPDAWVMLAPVLSGTNRKFGRMIERRAAPFMPGRNMIPLDPITALKLHAPTIPTCQQEVRDAYSNLKNWMLKSPNLTLEFDAVESTLLGLIEGKLRSFSR
jgi:hypothetical protein